MLGFKRRRTPVVAESIELKSKITVLEITGNTVILEFEGDAGRVAKFYLQPLDSVILNYNLTIYDR